MAGRGVVRREPSHGHVSLIIGPMFSGKTTMMSMTAERYARAGKRTVIVSPTCDNRYDFSEGVRNHRGHSFGDVTLLQTDLITNLDLNGYDMIGIDEGQFFPDIVQSVDNLANSGKIVIVAYLDSTFEKKPFGPIGELIARAEHCEKLSAVCGCGKDASFNKRLGGGKEEIEVGTNYVAQCRACFQQI